MLRFILRIILLLLLLALAYIGLTTFDFSPENITYFIAGLFKENAAFFQHPAVLLIIAIIVVVALINATNRQR